MAILLAAAIVITLLLPVSQGQYACPVGEKMSGASGVCNNANGDQICHSYCSNKYGAEFTKSECRDHPDRGDHGSECVCILKCAQAHWLGDPQYRTFDGVPFTFNGLCRHLALKSSKAQPSFPSFEMYFENMFEREDDHEVAYLRQLSFNVIDWGLFIEMRMEDLNVVEINENRIALPFFFNKFDGNREDYLAIVKTDSHMYVNTSFGLNLEITHFRGLTNQVIVYLPRVQQFMKHVEGIFGNFDGNKINDFIDRHGAQRNPKIAADAEAFGTSWCEDEEDQQVSQEDRERAHRDHDAKLRQCKENRQTRLDQLCGRLRWSKLAACLGEDLETVIGECLNDVCYASAEGPLAEEGAACAIVEAQNKMCEIHDEECEM